jgi:hypothetical protein
MRHMTMRRVRWWVPTLASLTYVNVVTIYAPGYGVLLTGVLVLLVGIVFGAVVQSPWLGERWYGSAWPGKMSDTSARFKLRLWAYLVTGTFVLFGCAALLYDILRRQGANGVVLWGPTLILALSGFACFVSAAANRPLDLDE